MVPRRNAETTALNALAWAASEGDILSKFLHFSGLDVSELRARAADPELLAALLDFILSNEAYAASFCAAEGLSAEELKAVRRALPGSALE